MNKYDECDCSKSDELGLSPQAECTKLKEECSSIICKLYGVVKKGKIHDEK